MPAIVTVAGILAYLDSFRGVFLFDDLQSIVENPAIRSLAAAARDLGGTERPLVTLSLALNHAMSGMNVWSYHGLNLIIHLLAGLALFAVIDSTLLTPRLRGTPWQSARWLAFVVALIWVVHPLQTESVTYLIQRGESMMGLFYLLALYGVIRGARSSRPAAWYAAAVVACALGMGTKAIMITAPVVVLIYDRVFLSNSLLDALRRRWPLYLGLAGTWLVLVATGIASGILDPTQRQGLTVGLGYRGSTPLQYALTQPGVIVHYLELSLWPHPLCLDYWWPLARTAHDIVPPLVAVALLLGLTIASFWRWPPMGFVGAWFFVVLAPTSSVIPIQDPAFEHRMYLPLAAVIIVVVVGLERALGRLVRARSGRRAVAVVAITAVAVACITATHSRNQDYESPLVMWANVVKTSPSNPRAHTDLGKALAESGRIDEAIRHLQTAIRLRPSYFPAHNNLGNALAAQGKAEKAIPHFRETIRLKPDYVEAHNNLGAALAQTGRIEEAIAELRRTLELDPRNVNAARNLALALQSPRKRAETTAQGKK
jgi:protein O-mannosyl-transferase